MLLALQSAIELEKYCGTPEFQSFYQAIEAMMRETIKRKYWDAERRLFADTPSGNKFSQHSNSMAILAGLADAQQADYIGKMMLSDTSMTQATIYFKYYLHKALAKAGLGDQYPEWLDIWRKNIELGLTTWGETSEVETTRSDCHAWGAIPNIDVYSIMLGIESDAPYFKKVRIVPNLGQMKVISGEIPHPDGKISVSYDKSRRNLKAEIILPENIDGTFIWEGKTHSLKGGINSLTL